MSETYKFHAFVSYSRLDFDEVNAFLQKLDLEVPEFKYWFDLEGIESGDEFVRKIVSSIDASERILFMLSGNSINSKWAEQEVMYARNSGKRIIPILLKGAKLTGWFLFTFGNIDCIDSQDSRQMSKLISNIRKWCGSKPSEFKVEKPLKPSPAETIPEDVKYHIDNDLCLDCGVCASVCPVDAIREGGRPHIDIDTCIECGACAPVCPVDAISV